MQHVITISIDEELLKNVDEELKTSTFNGRSQLICYLLHQFLHQRKQQKKILRFKLIYFGTILLCLILIILILITRV